MPHHILIVDDDTDARQMLGKFLGMAGYGVTFAANGWEALLSIDNTPVDLILLDIMMPGMDGATFLKILRRTAKFSHLPVIIVTAFSENETTARAREIGIDGMLPKTRRLLDELLEMVEGVLKTKAPALPGDGQEKAN